MGILAPRECQVVTLIADGMTAEEIGKSLYLSHHTVKGYLKTARKRLGAKNSAHLVALAIRTGQLTYEFPQK